MPKLRWAIALLLLLPLLAPAAALRVVTLAPHLTELAFAAGIVPVGVSDYADYPAAARALPRVASWQGVNIERVLALRPDVVLAWRGGNPQRQVEQLAALGVRIMWIDSDSLSGISAALDRLATISPQPQQAHQQAQALRDGFAALRRQYHRDRPLPVFLQFGDRPLFTAAGQTVQNEVLTLCGGRNLFADSRVPWPQVSREQVLARQPQAIVIPGDAAHATAVSAFWQPQLSVRVIAVADDWFSRPGPRLLLAARSLCQALAAR
ncbi:vitamin B12 ABC transporter substrate-binding protein BtuF [Pantoea sp. 1.19]|uniref:vitamin B12 ABC transporter substrate-binding protein BtuF n=1 Tax=Pantoea sp. 1.19 TaxID=1925589 RepID=UPI000B0ADD65|nr:vitamin B12 ABC transporter substrate-binding protein BtuF [Pantoea sp. 1.19]